MQIEITGEAERLIQAAMATGKFATVEEFIASMVKTSRLGAKMIAPESMPESVDASALPLKPLNADHSPTSDMEWTPADEWPARWEDDDLLAEAWRVKNEGIVPLSLAEIHSAMSSITGSLSDDVSEGRNERL